MTSTPISKSTLGRFVASYRNGYGRRPSGIEDGPIVLRIADVSGGAINLSSPRRVAMSPADCTTYDLRQGDLLFVRVNGSASLVGRCILVDKMPDDLSFNDHLIRVRLKGDIDPAYVRLICDAPQIRRVIVDEASTSAGQLTVNQDILSNLEIPLPTLPEQRRIAALLTNQLAAVDRARAATQAQLDATQSLSSAYLREVFDNPEAKQWPRNKLGAVCAVTKLAGFEYTEYVHYVPIGDFIALRAQNVRNTGLDLRNVVHITNEVASHIPRAKLRQGDVVMTFIGANIGEATWIDADDTYYCAPNIAKITPSEQKITPQFLARVLHSEQIRKQIASLNESTAQQSLSMQNIRDFEISVPPISTQQSIEKHLAQHLLATTRVAGPLEAQLASINALPSALLQRAFSGEL